MMHSYDEGYDDSHFLSEITGIKIVPILNQQGKGIDQFLKNNFAGCAKEDFELFLYEFLKLKEIPQ